MGAMKLAETTVHRHDFYDGMQAKQEKEDGICCTMIRVSSPSGRFGLHDRYHLVVAALMSEIMSYRAGAEIVLRFNTTEFTQHDVPTLSLSSAIAINTWCAGV